MNGRKYYAGIGSRQAPKKVLDQCIYIAGLLEKLGFVLRSGGAEGCDQAFERGVVSLENKQILRPKHSTPEAEQIAEGCHPAWNMCNDYAKKLHGRNVQLVLGPDIKTHSEFVLAWTLSPDRGGTRTGLIIARHYQIGAWNLANPEQNSFFMEKLERMFK